MRKQIEKTESSAFKEELGKLHDKARLWIEELDHIEEVMKEESEGWESGKLWKLRAPSTTKGDEGVSKLFACTFLRQLSTYTGLDFSTKQATASPPPASLRVHDTREVEV